MAARKDETPKRLDEFEGRPFFYTADGRKVTPDGEPFVEDGADSEVGEPPKE